MKVNFADKRTGDYGIKRSCRLLLGWNAVAALNFDFRNIILLWFYLLLLQLQQAANLYSILLISEPERATTTTDKIFEKNSSFHVK